MTCCEPRERLRNCRDVPRTFRLSLPIRYSTTARQISEASVKRHETAIAKLRHTITRNGSSNAPPKKLAKPACQHVGGLQDMRREAAGAEFVESLLG